jgi:hypothetical protein
MDDEQHDADPETAMERFEDLGRRIFRVSKEDVERVEESDDETVVEETETTEVVEEDD